MLEPEDEGPSQESAEIADGLLVGRDSPAGPQPPLNSPQGSPYDACARARRTSGVRKKNP